MADPIPFLRGSITLPSSSASSSGSWGSRVGEGVARPPRQRVARPDAIRPSSSPLLVGCVGGRAAPVLQPTRIVGKDSVSAATPSARRLIIADSGKGACAVAAAWAPPCLALRGDRCRGLVRLPVVVAAVFVFIEARAGRGDHIVSRPDEAGRRLKDESSCGERLG